MHAPSHHATPDHATAGTARPGHRDIAGVELLDELTRAVAEILGARHALVAALDPEQPTHATVLSVWSDGKRPAGFAYALEGEPCFVVAQGKPLVMADGAGAAFPRSRWIRQFAAAFYAGVPLRAADGTVTGLIAAFHDRPLEPVLSMQQERLVHALGERVKELTALHQAARILSDDVRPATEVMNELVALLPPAWQYPEITSARIAIGSDTYTAGAFAPGPWVQTVSFVTSSGAAGSIEVAYHEERPAAYEGPFLLEERHLINSLGQMICTALDRRTAWVEVTRINAELEARVAARTAALEGATRALETFAYSVAHDLKAPLRGIDGYSRLLLEDYATRLDDEGRTFLFNIRGAAQRMSRLIDDLLAYSLVDRRPMTPAFVSLRSLFDAILGERRDQLVEQRITVSDATQCDRVSADPDALAQAVRNYVDNAIKFTRDVAEPRIEIGSRAGDAGCIVWVRDNGIGFDMKYHDRIFEIFQRLHREEDHPGTGIGLAIVHKAMERLGGRAWAESAPGQGATFYLEIPRQE